MVEQTSYEKSVDCASVELSRR